MPEGESRIESPEPRRASGDTLGVVGSSLGLRTEGDRVDATLDVDTWFGGHRFIVTRAAVRAQTSTERRGAVLLGRAAIGTASDGTPVDLWWAGDTGRARAELLRAHPLVEHGSFAVGRLGRTLLGVTGESQYWWPSVPAIGLGAAAFVDAARTSRLLMPGARGDVDVGVGARVAVPTMPGVFRIDVAKGLRDGATTVSFVYAP
jgi:hypothetical protein